MNVEIRPYANEHAARLKDPKLFGKFRRENNAFGAGIHVIYGKYKKKKTWTIQAIRFQSSKWTVTKAKAWLKKHGYTYSLFEPATGKKSNFFKELIAPDYMEQFEDCPEINYPFNVD